MVSRIRKVPSFDLAVFGGTGDLAHRKLFPALFHRFLDAQFSQPTRIIGVSRRPLDHAAYRVAIADALRMVADGADILDIGGESTRPGAVPLPAREELRRLEPVLEGLRECLPWYVYRLSADLGVLALSTTNAPRSG